MMKNNHKFKSFVSLILSLCMLVSLMPTVLAAQSNEYVDPADSWLTSNSRTNEFDVNSTITNETQYCCVCRKDTSVLTYRVPEYTKTGETALNRDVKYSDGTCLDGVSKGNLDIGTPGVDAYYTGYHYTKSVCQTCGTINPSEGADNYPFNKNIYILNSCAHNFFLDFDSSTYERYDEDYHLTTLKRGEYCKFCKGTFARATKGLEDHNFTEKIDAQIGNNRFFIAETCDACGYESSEYVTAKSVVTSYYGVEDGEAHTLTVSDLSDRGVKTSIRYGNSADSCTKSSAPNYTNPGYYTVYYEIDYTYAGETMTENGVSYVWIVAEDEDDNGTIIILPQSHEHEFHYLETVKPSCVELGYERFQCSGCGELDKRNYTPAKGHDYDDIVIKESTCKQGGLVLTICSDCGDFYQTITSVGEHKYKSVKHNPTCKNVGYIDHVCEVCGYSYITDITPLVSHAYERITKEPDCENGGYTTSTCTMCGYNYVDNYTDALGHDWNEERTITNSTCDAEGVVENKCKLCDETKITATSAKGHKAGAKATCTTSQLCESCGTVLENAKGHNYESNVVKATCVTAGFTEHICRICQHSYTSDFTDVSEHEYEKDIVEASCSQHGFTHYSCINCDFEFDSDYVEKKAHNYTETIAEPSCVSLGYTTFICECGNTYKGEYKEPLGHTPSDWIIDVPATIENAGEKHIECRVCKETMQTAELPKLIGKDNSDEDGEAEVGAYSIILTDENGKPIFNSELTIDVNDNVSIKLAGGRLLDFEKPTTITAFYTETQQSKENLNIIIEDVNGNKATGMTNADGQLVVPNNKTNTGDDNGTIGKEDNEEKETYVITVTDKTNTIIPDCDIYIGESNNVVVDLPDGIKPTRENPVIITITDHNGNPQTDVTVIALGEADFIEKGKTDIYGKLTLPTASDGYTDENGKVNVDELNVIVNDELSFIANAYVQHNDDGTITVILPAEKTISYENRITVTVLDSVGNGVGEKSVTVKDNSDKTYQGLTDKNGAVVFPPLSEDITDNDGNSGIEETTPGEGENADDKTVKYSVSVADTKGNINNSFIKIEDGKVHITLPETHTLTTSNQTTATVTNESGEPVKGVSVTIADKTTSKTGTTDATGKVTLPVKSSSGSSSRPSSSGGGGGSSYSSTSVKITDKDGKSVSVSRSNGTNISTLTLPAGKNLLKDDNYYKITVTASSKPKKGYVIVLKDRNGNEVRGATDENGEIVLPSNEHKAYIFGYDDGTFKPDNDMSRAEAAAIFARLIAEEKGETIIGKSNFKDVSSKDWYSSYIGYLEKYDIIKGYADKTFKPDESVTRAEFVTMAVRYYALFNEVKKSSYTVNYTDLTKSYWAYADIAYAKHIGWLNGYADGTFKGDNNITRAEVVTVVNRATGRIADEEYVSKNTSVLNKFTDLNQNHWSYMDVMESANDHIGVKNKDGEAWIK